MIGYYGYKHMNKLIARVDKFKALYEPYLKDGTIKIDEKGNVNGIAEDGLEVNLGCFASLTSMDSLEMYLEDRPTPDKW